MQRKPRQTRREREGKQKRAPLTTEERKLLAEKHNARLRARAEERQRVKEKWEAEDQVAKETLRERRSLSSYTRIRMVLGTIAATVAPVLADCRGVK